MFKRISAVVMVAVMSAMLSLTAFAEVDREAVEKKLIEYFYEDDWASITRNADGDHIPIEDNPNASLYYNIYIRSFIDESSDERLENLDLTDETNNSVRKFVKFWFNDWRSEQPGIIDKFMNDGKSYNFLEEKDDSWIIEEIGGEEKEITIDKDDKSFIVNVKRY